MALHNPSNWHYVDTNVQPETEQYFKDEFEGLHAEEGGVTAKVSEVQKLPKQDDVYIHVSQKRGKLWALFMFTLEINFTGSAPDAEEVTGTITVGEIDWSMETDEYKYDVKLDENKKEHKPVKDLVERKILPDIKKVFDGLISHLTTEHGKSIQHDKGENPSTNFAKAAVHPEKHAAAADAFAKSSQENKSGGVVNVTSITDKTEFKAPADLLYDVFTNPEKIQQFTRAPIKTFEGAQPGGQFILFDGAVSGKYLRLDKPTHIEQNWRRDNWPKDHYSTLKLDFEQDDKHGVTYMHVKWGGIPVGKDEETKQMWDEAYVKGIQRAFGLGGGPGTSGLPL